MSHHSKYHFITQYISLRGAAVNEFYRMIRVGVAGHVRGNQGGSKNGWRILKIFWEDWYAGEKLGFRPQ